MSASRILLCPSAYYPSLGGVEEICRNVATVLTENGHTVMVAVNRHPSTLPERESLDGIQIFRFQFTAPNRSVGGALKLLNMPFHLAKYLQFVQQFNPDVIHVICPSSNSLYCCIAKLVFRKKLLVTLQGEFFMDAGDIYGRSAFARYAAQKLLSVADGVTACSEYVLKDAKQRFKFKTPVQKVVFNGVDLHEKAITIPDQTLPKQFILGVGRLVPNKGFDELIYAFKKLTEITAGIQLVVAGSGAELSNLQDLSSKLHLDSVIHFVGRQNRESISYLFSKCMFFVLPSHVEPFGIVCLESMRAGKPVIAANIGGPPEFIDAEKTGLLYSPRDIESLFSAMNRLCQDQTFREQLGKAAQQKAMDFSWTNITKMYEQLYQKI